MKLTIAIAKGEAYFIGTIKEIPGVITQGSSIEETRANVLDALQLYLETMDLESDLENIILKEDIVLTHVH